MLARPVRLPLPDAWEQRLAAVHFVFQPIVRADDLSVDGVEALLRGVDKAGFNAIQALFDQAYTDGVLHTFDIALRHKLLRESAPLLRQYNKRLFYNLDTRCVVDADDAARQTARLIAAAGLEPHQVCLEISEQHQLIPARHVAATLDLYRSQGYGVALDDFPKFRFFGADGAVKNFEGKADKESFLRYVQEEAGVWIGLPGQLGDMHGLAKEFAGAKDKAKVLKKAEAAAAKLPTADAEHGKYYVKVMTKASADGEFVTKETARLKKMQDDGSVSAAKKEQFGRRLNILSSFA